MKLLEKENVVASNVRAIAPARIVSKPQVAIRARVVQPSRSRDKALNELCGRVVAFSVILGVAYVGSTLMGYVALERARQSLRQGSDRADYARTEAKAARAGIESLTSPSALRAWADAHGFVAAQATASSAQGHSGSGLVVRR